MANIYKPRYKICYQLRNKIWINKNSKINGFYNLRASRTNKILIRRRLKSMKWIMIRRFLIPRVRNKTHGKYIYKNILQKKQQVKRFYGRLKEYQLQHIFKNQWKQQKAFKQDAFINALEKRLDIILYRSKILPTIFACNQFIAHQGILVNDNKVQNINYPLNYGDIITFNEKHWNLIYNRLLKKLINRNSGYNLLQNYYLKNFIKYKNNKKFYKNKSFKNKFKLAHEIRKLKFRYMRLIRLMNYIEKNNLYSKNKINILQKILYIKISPKITRINKLMKLFNTKKNINIKLFERELILLMLSVQKSINQYIYIYKMQQLLLYNFDDQELKSKKILIQLFKNYKVKNNKLVKLTKILFLRGNYHNTRKFKKYTKRKLKRIYQTGKNIKGFHNQPNWYIPNYLEIDYNTLQLSYIYKPNSNELVYPFFFSVNELITFYRNKGF